MQTTSSDCTFFHPLSEHDEAVMAHIRELVEPNKGKLRGVAARPAFDSVIQMTSAPEEVSYRADTVGGVKGWWCEPEKAIDGRAILHLHGGWFNWGTAEAFRHLVGHIARASLAKAFIPDYALAPEHPYPAAPRDVKACFEGILELGIDAVAVTGDSAGGNLALGLLTQIASGSLSHHGRLVGVVALSPVTDLTLSGESWTSRAAADPLFLRDQAEELVAAYLAGGNANDPIASPLFGDLSGLPPIRVQVGNDEVLRDDATRYVERAVAAGVDAKVDVWAGMMHGFLGNVGHLEAADSALEDIGAFLSERFAAKR